MSDKNKQYFIWSVNREIYIGPIVTNSFSAFVPKVVGSIDEAKDYMEIWANDTRCREEFDIDLDDEFYVVETNTGKKAATITLNEGSFIVKMKKT